MRTPSLGVAAAATIGFVALVSTGCGLNMEKHYRNYRGDLLSGNFDEADEYIEKKKEDFYGKKNRLLYYMDRGMVQHLGKRYKDSNAFLEKAKDAAQELWTDSVGENAASWLTTDNSVSYQGEDFEKVMIHFVGALNRIGQGDYSGARVEARQITNKLELYNSKYEDEHKSVYRDDAFARWLAGMLSETEGGYSALNDAWIDYKKALQVYREDYGKRYRTPVPSLLVADALRVLDGLGADFAEELEQVKSQYPSTRFTPHEQASQMGKVLFLHLAGEAPFKRDKFWTAKANEKIIRIAFPVFVPKPHRITKARISAGSTQSTTVLGENVTAIAIQNLADHMGRIKAKAIARTIAKLVAQEGMDKGGKALSKSKNDKAKAAGAALQVAGALWNVGSAIAEEADKRSWLTLPSTVGVAQIFVPPGKVSLKVDFLTASGAVARTKTFEGEVKAGGTIFFSHRTFE